MILAPFQFQIKQQNIQTLNYKQLSFIQCELTIFKVIINNLFMNNEQCFIQLPFKNNQDDSLFPDLQIDYNHLFIDNHRQNSIRQQEEEKIDEELLKKTSELHEALRNLKLLQFELIQSQIMKEDNLKQCVQLEQEAEKLNLQIHRFRQQNLQLQEEIMKFEREIRYSINQNKAHQKKLTVITNELVDRKMKLHHFIHKSELLQYMDHNQNKDQQNIYISIEKMKLQVANNSKNDVVAELKKDIIIARKNIQDKELQNQSLEKQYQSLLAQIQTLQHQSKHKKPNHSNLFDNKRPQIHDTREYKIGTNNFSQYKMQEIHRNSEKYSKSYTYKQNCTNRVNNKSTLKKAVKML